MSQFFFFSSKHPITGGSYLSGELTPGKVITTSEPAVSLYYYSPLDSTRDYPADRGFSLFASFTPLLPHPQDEEDEVVGVGTAGCLTAIGKYLPRQQHEAFVPNCGADFLNSSGVLKSPNYPANYSGNLRCRWTVYAPGATRMGIVVEVETEAYFDKLFVLRSEQEGCRPLAKGGESIVLEEGGESIVLKEGRMSIVMEEGGESFVLEEGMMSIVMEEGGDSIVVEEGGESTVLEEGGESIVLEEGGESIALEEGGVFYLSSNAFSVYFFSDETVAAQGFRIFWYAIEV